MNYKDIRFKAKDSYNFGENLLHFLEEKYLKASRNNFNK